MNGDREAGAAQPSAATAFTNLDQLLRRATLDAAQEVAGALSPAEIDAAVDEFVRLNGQRPSSHFHAGLRDALWERPLAEARLSSEQARWYWAGVVHGLASSRSWPRIVREYDARTDLQALGGVAADEAGAGLPVVVDSMLAEVVGHIVDALQREGRAADLATFVKPRAVAGSGALFRQLLDAATACLRDDKVAEARRILDLLDEAAGLDDVAGPASAGDAAAAGSLAAEAKYHRSRCLRRLGDHDGARALLEEVVALRPGPELETAAQSDLGLLDGGFSRLEEVALPDVPEAPESFLAKVEKGEGRLENAIEAGGPAAGEARYCLGVYYLGYDNDKSAAGKAAEHLERAKAEFLRRPDRYGPMSARVHTYCGAARILCAGSSDAFARGAEALVRGLDEGEPLPGFLIAPVIEAVSRAEPRDLAAVCEAIFRDKDDSALDAIARSDSALRHCGMAVRALHERGTRNDRPREMAAADLRAALRGYMAAGKDYAAAADVLDQLERLAREHSAGIEEFVALLGDPSQYDPAWDEDEAAEAIAACHDMRGRRVEAVEALIPLFHKLMSTRREFERDEAENVLELIGKYDPGYDAKSLRGRLDAEAEGMGLGGGAEVAVAGDSAEVLKVLVVGELGRDLQDKIRSRVREMPSLVEVDFFPIEWKSSWNQYLDRFNNGLVGRDAVVLITAAMRTQLGKQIRKACGQRNKHWRSARTNGPNIVAKAVVRAAQAARA